MPGSVTTNFHEGSRTEYLANYVFAMTGYSTAPRTLNSPSAQVLKASVIAASLRGSLGRDVGQFARRLDAGRRMFAKLSRDEVGVAPAFGSRWSELRPMAARQGGRETPERIAAHGGSNDADVHRPAVVRR